jgi:glycerol 3-phosphatase-2
MLTAAERLGGGRVLAVGDRLDTDIAGARAAGVDALLVLTGVTTTSELLAAVPEQRPTYVAADLRGLDRDLPSLDGPAAAAAGVEEEAAALLQAAWREPAQAVPPERLRELLAGAGSTSA